MPIPPISALASLLMAFATLSIEQAPSAQQTVNGQQQLNLLFQTAAYHMGVTQVDPHVVDGNGVQEIHYNLPNGGRFATARLSQDGALTEFSVNSPDDGRAYRPIGNRGAFLRKVIAILSPEILPAERDWAVVQLDNPARQWTPSFPIVVGGFVYRLHRANLHDHFRIATADSSTPGWRYLQHSKR